MLIPLVCHSDQFTVIQPSLTNTDEILCGSVEGRTQVNLYWEVYCVLGTVLAPVSTKLRRPGLQPQEAPTTTAPTPTPTPGQPFSSLLFSHETWSQESK